MSSLIKWNRTIVTCIIDVTKCLMMYFSYNRATSSPTISCLVGRSHWALTLTLTIHLQLPAILLLIWLSRPIYKSKWCYGNLKLTTKLQHFNILIMSKSIGPRTHQFQKLKFNRNFPLSLRDRYWSSLPATLTL